MKRRTKIAVFIASMALTVGSLITLVGPRYCGHRLHNTCMHDHNNNNRQVPNQDASTKTEFK